MFAARRVALLRGPATRAFRSMGSVASNAPPSNALKAGAAVGTLAAMYAFSGSYLFHDYEYVEPKVAASAAETDGLTPTYEDLALKESDGGFVMTWNQHGVEYTQTIDSTGSIVDGPRPVNPPAVEEAVEEAVPVAESSAAPSAEVEALLKELADRIGNIEASLAADKRTAPSAGLLDYPHWDSTNKSLTRKHLTKDVFLECADRATPNGFTLALAIQSAVDNQDSGVGIYAGDEETYTVFAPIFDRVIEDYHNGFKPTDKHQSDMDASKLIGTPDPEEQYVISTRIRVGRNIRGLGLSPGCSRAQRREVERIVTGALAQLDGNLAGKYYSLGNMSEDDRKQLVADHFLFKKGDRFLQSAGANRDWPESRGIFHNQEKTFLVWVNEEDQMRIISMQKGGDAKQIFERLADGINAIEAKVKDAGYEFAHNEHLGYIHSCPTNCGTGMRASVHVKLPNVGKHPDFKKWCSQLRLQPRGIHGEHSESVGGVYDISNKERLGRSEVELVQTMIDGVKTLINAEKALANGVALPSELSA
jgi:protein-arginine kinase